MKKFYSLLALAAMLCCSISSYSQISGCLDANASNFDASATEDDGSCLYLCTEDPSNLLDVSNAGAFDGGSGLSFGAPNAMGLLAGANNDFAGFIWNVNTAGVSNSDFCISIDYTVTADPSVFPITLEFRIENNGCGGFPCPWLDFNTVVTEPGTFTLGGIVSTGNPSGAGAFDPDGANPSIVAAIANFSGTPLASDVTVSFSNLCVSTNCGAGTLGCADPVANNYDPMATIDDGSCLYNYTFEVDMNCWDGNDPNIESTPNYPGFSAVSVEGPLFGWCGGCAPLADDDGDGIWSATFELPLGPFEYKYAIDGFAGQENLVDDAAGGATCAPITDFGTFANRQITIEPNGTAMDTYGSCEGCNVPEPVSIVYCDTLVQHLGIPAETASEIMLTITNSGPNSVTVTIASSNSDPVDVIVLNAFGGPITGSPGLSAPDTSVPGQISQTMTWAGTPPSQIELNILWSKESFPGNWQLGTENTLIDFDNVCPMAAISGCTDPMASNYDPEATEEDGSCLFLCAEDPDNLFGIANSGGFDGGSGLSFGSNTGMGLLAGANFDFAGYIWSLNTAGLSTSDFCISMDFTVTGDPAAFPATIEFRIENNGCGFFPCPWNDFNTLVTEPGTYTLGGIVSSGNPASGGFDPNGPNPAIVAAIANFSGTPQAADINIGFSNLCVSTDCGGDVPGCIDEAAVNFNPEANIDDGSCLFNFNFEVDMNCWDGNDSNIELSSGLTSFSNVSVESPVFGWCGGCAPLADDDGDGIWTGTFQVPGGQFEYKYAIDFFAGQEQLIDDVAAGETCAPVTDGVNFANRLIDIVPNGTTSDTYGTCGSCETTVPGCTDEWAANFDPDATIDDGSCMYNVTFTVDMNCESGFTTPYVTGPFVGWCGDCIPMADNDGDGIWTAVVPFPQFTSVEYKYEVDNFASQEDLIDDAVNGGDCAPITDFFSFANRLLEVEDMAVVATDVYGTCGDCEPVACEPASFLDAPTNLDEEITSPVTILSWSEIPGSSACQVQGNVVGSSFFPTFLVQGDAPDAWFVNNLNLNDGATYQWRVRCGCSATPLVATPWSEWSFFTFNQLLQTNDNLELRNTSIYPNPNTGDFNLQVDAEGKGLVQIRIYNLLGSVVYNSSRSMQSENETFQISLEGQEKGIYFVDVISETSKLTKKVILE